jgi:hypothetical protein
MRSLATVVTLVGLLGVSAVVAQKDGEKKKDLGVRA